MARWVTVHRGPIWEVELRAGYLEEEGIATFVPDSMNKVQNPFGTGALPLDAQLQVDEVDTVRARTLLDALGKEGPERVTEEELEALALSTPPDPALGVSPAEARAPEDRDPVSRDPDPWTRDEVETLARRTRWSALLGITHPFGIFYGWFYLGAARESGIRDSAHRFTLTAFWICVALGILDIFGLMISLAGRAGH